MGTEQRLDYETQVLSVSLSLRVQGQVYVRGTTRGKHTRSQQQEEPLLLTLSPSRPKPLFLKTRD